jgi:hypothetical protein
MSSVFFKEPPAQVSLDLWDNEGGQREGFTEGGEGNESAKCTTVKSKSWDLKITDGFFKVCIQMS